VPRSMHLEQQDLGRYDVRIAVRRRFLPQSAVGQSDLGMIRTRSVLNSARLLEGQSSENLQRVNSNRIIPVVYG